MVSPNCGPLATSSSSSSLPFPVRGVLWYQGESNATVDGGRGAPVAKAINRRKFEALIGSWRRAWRDDSLPVLFVQLPGLNRNWPLFRQMQLEVAQEDEHAGMAVTIDVGHPTNVHPANKRPVCIICQPASCTAAPV